MARVKLTEYKAKQLLFSLRGYPYDGISAHIDSRGDVSFSIPLEQLSRDGRYVVKVDEGIKGRMKKGLVQLRIANDKLKKTIQKLSQKGYAHFLIEPMVSYNVSDERYISMERTREGILVRYAAVGGVDIESMQDKVKTAVITYQCHSDTDFNREKNPENQYMDTSLTLSMTQELGVPVVFIHKLLNYFEDNYISFMEINPLVVIGEDIHILDLAVEVDSTAKFFVHHGWSSDDVVGERAQSPEEKAVKKLNDQSQASFSFTLLNTTGLLWVLLSGGGASIVVADEAYNMDFGTELANYGEYSGNPNEDETYEYTCSLISAMMKSSRRRLMLIIGGGVANFTDIGKTFKGVIKALEKNKSRLKKKDIKIFVRRGGPHEKKGLKMMEEWLKANDMYGLVTSPKLPLHDIMKEAIGQLTQ